MDDKEKPAIEKAADKVNDVVEEITLKAADAAIEPDPAHVAGAANEQVYLPEASHSGRITPTYECPVPDSPMTVPKKPAKKKSSAKKTATKSTKKAAKKSAAKKNKKTAMKSSVRTAKKAKRKSKK
jgi:hypothetical protein